MQTGEEPVKVSLRLACARPLTEPSRRLLETPLPLENEGTQSKAQKPQNKPSVEFTSLVKERREEKTTLLNILASFIPKHERILVIEDTAEIQITTPNMVRFEARREHDGMPAVGIRDLLKASLRHRPDRILLGEIRGAEAFDLLQLLNTGHAGTISTVHASSAQQALSRFTSCVLQSNVELPYRAIKSNIADSLNLLIHIERRLGRRCVSGVLKIARYDLENDRYVFNEIFLGEEGS